MSLNQQFGVYTSSPNLGSFPIQNLTVEISIWGSEHHLPNLRLEENHTASHSSLALLACSREQAYRIMTLLREQFRKEAESLQLKESLKNDPLVQNSESDGCSFRDASSTSSAQQSTSAQSTQSSNAGQSYIICKNCRAPILRSNNHWWHVLTGKPYCNQWAEPAT